MTAAKRSWLILLSASLLAPVTPAAAAWKQPAPEYAAAAAVNAKFSREAALQRAASLISLPSDVELENAYFRSADVWRPIPEWSFTWGKQGKENGETSTNINVSINADTGELTNYNYFEEKQSAPAFASQISREEAQQVADRFFAQVLPAKVGKMRLYDRDLPQAKPPLDSNAFYTFHYVRLVDGVLFPDNYVDIVVNGEGKVTGMHMEWNDRITLPRTDSILSREKALAAFQAQAQAGLSYMIPWEKADNGQNELYLVYRNPFTFYLDAKTGKPLTLSLKPRSNESGPIPVSTKPLAPLYQGNPLSQEMAVRLAQKLFDLSLYELRGANYNEKDYRGNRPVWNLEFEAKDKAITPGYLFLSIDAQTGDVYSFSREKRPVTQAAKPKWTADDLKAKAIESLRRWTPTLAPQFYLTTQADAEPYSADDTRATFAFKRYVNGIPSATGSASVSFDTVTGELVNYNLEIGRETYPPSLPAHKSAEEAMAAWLKEAEIELVYLVPPLDPKLVREAKSRGNVEIPVRQAELVYRISTTPYEQPYVLDAVTGEWRNEANGDVAMIHRPVPADISGHPAEKALMLMYEYDAISLIDGKVLPDRAITRGEMIEMLMISMNRGRFFSGAYAQRKASYQDVASGSRYFASVEAAVDQGILDKSSKTLHPDDAITREELADMIVRALGLKKLSQHDDMFRSELTDIQNSKVKGAIAIVNSLGIMPADGNRFHPGDTVSRADAALAFYRFLEKRSELQDNRQPFAK
ncbi:S-layer homology domain-containing protein [Brevibacillus sp. SYP-B805]|uniref:S-layer homology domain-containing protein n=1 Tax=Brevibacillus sp. SYP-B805 TaxID=1578199 RepID=UPI0013EBA364|nr:S-layer homology domain-containing protein [Brevibacillus sp. SYP-B805]NGQ97265.1 S-layer homology domain-containing protein [Brevibacillus sp. SYP-B805]